MKKLLMVLFAAVLPASLAAQQQDGSGSRFTFAGFASQEIVHSKEGVANDRFSGMVLGGSANLSIGRLVARARYAQGRVSSKAGGIDPRDVVEGELLVGYRVMPWLTLWAGPSARAYTTEDSEQRWFIWSGRAAGRGTIIPGKMQSFVELWGALSGNLSNPAMKAGGRGLDAGLEMRLSQTSPFWGRLSYRMESTHAVDLRETVEAVSLSVIYGLPQ